MCSSSPAPAGAAPAEAAAAEASEAAAPAAEATPEAAEGSDGIEAAATEAARSGGRLVYHDRREDEDDEQQDPARQRRRQGSGPGWRARERDAARVGDARGQRHDATPHALVDATGAKGGDDLAVLDLADEPVGQNSLEAVPDQ